MKPANRIHTTPLTPTPTPTNPPTHPQPHQLPLPTNPKISIMLNEVTLRITYFLEELQVIYDKNGIDFDVGYLENAVLRLLTPFQLGVEMGAGGSYWGRRNQCQGEFQDISYRYETTPFDLKLIPILQPTPTPTPQPPKKSKPPGKPPRKPSKPTGKSPTKPILPQQIQQEVVEWAFKKLSQNKPLRRKDLGKKAMKLSGFMEGFMGSVGWVNRFLGRHPKLLEYLNDVGKVKGRRRYGEDEGEGWSQGDQGEIQRYQDKLEYGQTYREQEEFSSYNFIPNNQHINKTSQKNNPNTPNNNPQK